MSGDDLAAKFNGILKKIGRVYLNRKKGAFDEAKAYRTNKRIHIIMLAHPTFLMENIGPFYLEYADIIHHRKWDEFRKMDFSREKQSYKETDDGSAKSDEEIEAHIQCIRDLWDSTPELEQEALGDMSQELLSIYCQYCVLAKKERNV